MFSLSTNPHIPGFVTFLLRVGAKLKRSLWPAGGWLTAGGDHDGLVSPTSLSLTTKGRERKNAGCMMKTVTSEDQHLHGGQEVQIRLLFQSLTCSSCQHV